MSGRWTLSGPGIAFTPGTFAHGASIGTGDGPHDHLVMEFEGGIRATYTDARRFGYVHLIERQLCLTDRYLCMTEVSVSNRNIPVSERQCV